MNAEQKQPVSSALPPGFTDGQRYYAFSRFLRERFGGKIYRVTVDGGFTCPNVDGTVAVGGCVYCDNRSFSPNRRLPRKTIRDQVQFGIEKMRDRVGAERFLAYFQAATNTYAPVAKLKARYDEALDHPQVVGLMIGTRPDCMGDDVLELIESYAKNRYVCVEVGLQSMFDRTLDWMNRGHHFDAFEDAIARAHGRGFDLCVHVILGLPGETHEELMRTADMLAGLPIQAVKIHNLHVVKRTPLEEQFRAGEVKILELDEYVCLLCDFLERLPSALVMHRLNGDAPPDYLVAPTWCLDKHAFLRAVAVELQRRDSWQGKSARA